MRKIGKMRINSRFFRHHCTRNARVILYNGDKVIVYKYHGCGNSF